MNQFCSVIGYPSRQDGVVLPTWYCLLYQARKWYPIFHIINPLLTKLVMPRWLEIGLDFVFYLFMDLDCISVLKHKKRILTNIQLFWSNKLGQLLILNVKSFASLKMLKCTLWYAFNICKQSDLVLYQCGQIPYII